MRINKKKYKWFLYLMGTSPVIFTQRLNQIGKCFYIYT